MKLEKSLKDYNLFYVINKAEKKKDCIRDEWLKNQGFKVLRFWNNDVFKNMNGILGVIIESCLNHPPLTPPIKGGAIK